MISKHSLHLVRLSRRYCCTRSFTGSDFHIPPINSENIRSVFPGGSANGEFNLPSELDTVIVEGKGCELTDSNNNLLIDFSMGWGSNLVGHANDHIVDRIEQVCKKGSNFAYINEQAYKLGHRIKSISPCIDMLRYCASGTEATMYCLRLARAYANSKYSNINGINGSISTSGKKTKVLKFEGAYHGGNEIGITSLFTDPNRFDQIPYPQPDIITSSSGMITREIEQNTLVAPFNDIDITTAIIETNKNELAAIIVEPLHRCTPPKQG